MLVTVLIIWPILWIKWRWQVLCYGAGISNLVSQIIVRVMCYALIPFGSIEVPRNDPLMEKYLERKYPPKIKSLKGKIKAVKHVESNNFLKIYMQVALRKMKKNVNMHFLKKNKLAVIGLIN